MWKKHHLVIQHLIKWELLELNNFLSYLRCFHPQKRVCLSYLNRVIKEWKSLRKVNYPIEKFYKKLQTNASKHTIQNNLSLLKQLKEEYIVFTACGQHPNQWQKALALLKYRLQKGLDLKKVEKQREKIQFDEDVRGVASYIFQYQYYFELYHNPRLFQISQYRDRIVYQLHQAHLLLDYLHYLEHSLENFILNNQIGLSTVPISTPIHLKTSYDNLPLVNTYHLLIHAYEKGAINRAYTAQTYLLDQFKHFDKEQQNLFLIKLKNLFVYHYRKGQISSEEIAKCLLNITQIRIEADLLTVDGVLTPINFDNIINSAIKVKRWTWIDHFLKNMQHKLPLEIKDEVLSLSRAKISFYKDQDYDKVLDYLPEERKQFQILTFDFQVRGLRIASYIEKNKQAIYFDKIDNLINATQAKLQFEKKHIREKQLQIFQNFFKMARYIGIEQKSKEQLSKLFQIPQPCLLSAWVKAQLE